MCQVVWDEPAIVEKAVITFGTSLTFMVTSIHLTVF